MAEEVGGTTSLGVVPPWPAFVTAPSLAACLKLLPLQPGPSSAHPAPPCCPLCLHQWWSWCEPRVQPNHLWLLQMRWTRSLEALSPAVCRTGSAWLTDGTRSIDVAWDSERGRVLLSSCQKPESQLANDKRIPVSLMSGTQCSTCQHSSYLGSQYLWKVYKSAAVQLNPWQPELLFLASFWSNPALMNQTDQLPAAAGVQETHSMLESSVFNGGSPPGLPDYSIIQITDYFFVLEVIPYW